MRNRSNGNAPIGDAPKNLTEEEKSVWAEIAENAPQLTRMHRSVLQLYVKTMVQYRKTDNEIKTIMEEGLTDPNMERFDKLLKLREFDSEQLLKFFTLLGLTPKARAETEEKQRKKEEEQKQKEEFQQKEEPPEASQNIK